MLRFCWAFLALAVSVPCLFTLAVAAPVDSAKLHAGWQAVLERRVFHFPKEGSNMIGSLIRFSADCNVHMVYDPKHRDAIEYKFVRDRREVLSLKGHILSAFATGGDHLYF